MFLVIRHLLLFCSFNLLNRRSSLTIKNVGLNETRIGFYKLLKKHGGKIIFKNLKRKDNEIRGDIFVRSCSLKPYKGK